MLLHPEVQRRAHAELDLLLQSQTTENGDVRSSSTDHNDPRMVPLRLPELSDRDALPYIQAIVLEVMRWYPAVPLGVPHRLIQDDEYKGMWIRGGSTVVVNQWYAQSSYIFINMLTSITSQGDLSQ
jgi:cytochrome P450